MSGLWPSIREAKPKWAPVRGSSLSTSPHTSCPGSACTTGASEASPSQRGAAKKGGKRRRRHPSNLSRQRLTSQQGQPRGAHKSNTGPSTGLDRFRDAQQTYPLSLVTFRAFRASKKCKTNLRGLQVQRWSSSCCVRSLPTLLCPVVCYDLSTGLY